jgi:LysR family transcriptional regulator for metE and metH
LILDIVHLRILSALDQHGTLTEAAKRLHLTQSALSHQIRDLERKLGTPLWEKAGRRLRLTLAGRQLVETAGQVLPVLEQAERRLKAYAEGRWAVLRIGVECYPCSEWLNGIIGAYLRAMPEVELDIVNQFHFSGEQGLVEREIDLLITPDQGAQPQLTYQGLFDYELVLLVSETHPLARVVRVEPAQLAEETLISFPVAPERLDILTQFLWPAGVRPQGQKRVESIEIMLQLVACRRGVCALPRWLAQRYGEQLPLVPLGLGEGIQRTLYAAMREEDVALPHLQRLVELGRSNPV